MNMIDIRIDVSRALAQKHGMPRDDHYGSWTFVIGDNPITLFGTYAEARSMAKFYVRMYDAADEPVELTRFTASGQVYTTH